MLDAVDQLAASADAAADAVVDSADGASGHPAAQQGPAFRQLVPEQYVSTWNAAVQAGLEGCVDRWCPKEDAPGAPLAGVLRGPAYPCLAVVT